MYPDCLPPIIMPNTQPLIWKTHLFIHKITNQQHKNFKDYHIKHCTKRKKGRALNAAIEVDFCKDVWGDWASQRVTPRMCSRGFLDMVSPSKYFFFLKATLRPTKKAKKLEKVGRHCTTTLQPSHSYNCLNTNNLWEIWHKTSF